MLTFLYGMAYRISLNGGVSSQKLENSSFKIQALEVETKRVNILN
jgi:hypothetical protein